jgi:transcriptional regulator with XRE-family HTH domain
MTQMATTTPSAFALRVRQEMKAQGLSVRGLARKIDPENLDRVRRNLHRWLDEGILPSRSSREEVALALGISVDVLEAGHDVDGERDRIVASLLPFAQLMADLATEARKAAATADPEEVEHVG